MKKLFLVVMLSVTLPVIPQTKYGKWLDTTKDSQGSTLTWGGSKVLMTEEYEVTQTHEICADVEEFFMEKSNIGHFDVDFKGMRTSARFEFTTRYAAEHWVEKFCTPDSLLSIRNGRGARLQ